MPITAYYPHFFTATILEWKKLLKPNKYKDVIIESLSFLVKEQRVFIYSFVIMQNHIHLIWQICGGHKREEIQRDFLKYTAQKMKADLQKHHPKVLPYFLVNAKDRKFQLWERNALSIELLTHKVLLQKLAYIHQNPLRAGICNEPEQYHYSSARFYYTGVDNWGFLTHYTGN